MPLIPGPDCGKKPAAEGCDYELLQRPPENILSNHDSRPEQYEESDAEEEIGGISGSSSEDNDVVSHRLGKRKSSCIPLNQDEKKKAGYGWVKTMQDEILNDDFGCMGFDQNDRGVEAYKFRLLGQENKCSSVRVASDASRNKNPQKKSKKKKKKKKSKKARKRESLISKLNGESRKSKNIRESDVANLKLNGTHRKNLGSLETKKRILKDLILEGVTDLDLVKQLATCLYEKNIQLLSRAVEILGHERVIHFYNMTKELEAAGGRIVAKGDRRRTSGGVFISLIRAANDVTEVEKKIIFTEPNNSAWPKKWPKRKNNGFERAPIGSNVQIELIDGRKIVENETEGISDAEKCISVA